MQTISGSKKSCLLALLLAGCLDAQAASTGTTTQYLKTAAPANSINLSGVSASEGTSLATLRADATFGISGTLPLVRGGTGSNATSACSGATPVLSSNGTQFICAGVPVAGITGVLPEANGGTNSGALTCTNQFVTSNGTSYSCVTDTLAGGQHASQGTTTTVLHGNAAGNPSWASVSMTADVSGILPEANGGTNAGALTCSSAQGVTSNGTSYSCHDNAITPDATLTGTGTSGSPLGIALTHGNTWTAPQVFSPSVTGNTGVTSTGNTTGLGAVLTGGASSGTGAQVTAGAALASANGGIGMTLQSTQGGIGVAGGAGGIGGDTLQLFAANGGAGNGAGAGGVGGLTFHQQTTGGGGNGGSTGNGGVGGSLFGLLQAGNGGAGGASAGLGGNGGSLGTFVAGTGGNPTLATGTAGAGGAGLLISGGTGGSTSGAGTAGAGGAALTVTGGSAGTTVGGTGANGGFAAFITGGNASSVGNGDGGYGMTLSAGNGHGSGNNGDGLVVASGSGGTGTANGWAAKFVQNNTIHAHINLLPVTSDPSSLSNGDLWFMGVTGAMTAKVRLNGVTQPVLTFGVTGSGATQKLRVAGCATTASVGAVCSTTVTWPTSWGDTSYTVECTGDLITSGVPVNGGVNAKVAASVTFQTVAMTAVAAQYTTIDCTAIHD